MDIHGNGSFGGQKLHVACMYLHCALCVVTCMDKNLCKKKKSCSDLLSLGNNFRDLDNILPKL